MPCGKKHYKKIRAVDVGRPGHHYLKIGVTGKGSSVAISPLIEYKKKR